MITNLGNFRIEINAATNGWGEDRYEAVVTDELNRQRKLFVSPYGDGPGKRKAFFEIRDLIAEAISARLCPDHPEYEKRPDGTAKLITP